MCKFKNDRLVKKIKCICFVCRTKAKKKLAKKCKSRTYRREVNFDEN